ncbi:YT521-B-like domain-containing protein [Pyrenochaeta sp. MPI-SDFR-AT-0127]|nr:YT521-B-like domain-containing protein [Pyrenochaeta sp. MPI-SDFR-AT-0127]
MGDLPPGSRPQALNNAATGFARDGTPSASSPYKSPDNTAPFYSQLSAIPQGQLRQDFRPSTHPGAQYHPQEHGPSPLNMGSMAGTLPDYGSFDDASVNPQSVPRSLPGASTSAVAYQLGQNPPMPTHSPYGPGYSTNPYQQSFMPPQNSQHSVYPPFATNQPRQAGATTIQSPYPGYPQAPQYMYYPSPYGVQGQFAPSFMAQGAQGQAMYGRRASLTTLGQGADFSQPDSGFPVGRMGSGNLQGDQGSYGPAYGISFAQGPSMSRTGHVSSIPRGPPRKPKQSGHALWVGNLPPGTTVVALKDHFSREATKEIESLFLISKSNCAFVNYRTEESCTAAMHRFHDSRFNGVRLVCRLRRSSAPASGVPTGPSAMVGNHQQSISRPVTPKQDSVTDPITDSEPDPTTHSSNEDARATADTTNKYFIVKSLTLQDLELSVRNGIWATQSHNEDALNKAFRSAENVYLIFSANKSGEYFGYARMASPILEDGSEFIGSAPKTENIVDTQDVPKSIPTPATEWAPRGKIIDDSARGTIFWEAELSDSEGEDESVVEKEEAVQPDGDISATAQSWGKPFKIEWVSTNRLPFYRTRGLRNPWNANREVKIARDGTELEPSVGERLIQMFHRLGPSTAGAALSPPQFGGPVNPQMRPF